MFSKEESARIRQEFWTSFGKSFVNDWTLYNTKIKDFSFKFYFDTKKAGVYLDIENPDFKEREKYFNKLISLKSILKQEFFSEIYFEKDFVLDSEKVISRLYIEKQNLCIHNKNTWQEAMEFLNENMLKFESFWAEYEEFIKEF